MGQLTQDERRRIFLARQRTRHEMLARISAPIALVEPRSPRYVVSQVLKTAMAVALLGGGWLAFHVVQFHVPTSLVEALMPRL
jgi:hypothetical protein